MTDIIKWQQLYKIVFKDDKNEPKIILPKNYEDIKQKLFKNEWIEVDGELYNPFIIAKIVKFKTQDGITSRLNTESESVQTKVREMMRLYKNTLTLGVLENMIRKAKGLDI